MKTVLVVELDSALSWLMCESLNSAGYNALPSGPEQAPEAAVRIGADAIVASLSSLAIDQAPLYKSLKQDPRTQKIPLILITGRGDVTIRRRLNETPPRVLFKPFEQSALVEAVAQALGDA